MSWLSSSKSMLSLFPALAPLSRWEQHWNGLGGPSMPVSAPDYSPSAGSMRTRNGHSLPIQETVTDFIFLSSKITANGDYSHEIKRCLLLGRKAMTNLDSTLKSRDITLATKVCLVKAMVFPVVMYGCKNWTIKKAEHWRIDASELWRWESLGLQGDPTSPSYRKSTLNIHWKDWCWSWSSNALAIWYEEPTHGKKPWCWER